MAKRLKTKVVLKPFYDGDEKLTDVFRRVLRDEMERKLQEYEKERMNTTKTSDENKAATSA